MKLKETHAYGIIVTESIVSVGCFSEGGFLSETTVQYRIILQIKP